MLFCRYFIQFPRQINHVLPVLPLTLYKITTKISSIFNINFTIIYILFIYYFFDNSDNGLGLLNIYPCTILSEVNCISFNCSSVSTPSATIL